MVPEETNPELNDATFDEATAVPVEFKNHEAV
jgi:hypothetical protein